MADGRRGAAGRRSRGAGRAARASASERLTGLHPIGEALRARRRPLVALHAASGTGHPGIAELVALARDAGIAVHEHSGADAQRLAAPGAELEAGPLPERTLEELLLDPTGDGPRTLVALDGVEDPQNLGALARVAEAAGVAGLVLTQRHAPPLSAAVSRASAGAIEWLPVARVPNLARALEQLKEEGFWVLGAEAEAEVPLYELPDRLASADRVVVLGAEGSGIRPGVAARIDRMLAIPLGGRVASLNVSTAAAVVLFELRRRAEATV